MILREKNEKKWEMCIGSLIQTAKRGIECLGRSTQDEQLCTACASAPIEYIM